MTPRSRDPTGSVIVPDEVLKRFGTDTESAEKLAGASVTLWHADQAAFKRFFAAEIQKWREVVKKANLKFD